MTRRFSRLTATAIAALMLAGSAAIGGQEIPPAQTPQGKVALAYYKAANAGDVAMLKSVLTTASADVLNGSNGPRLVEALKGQTPPGAIITKVTTDGATSRVDAEFKVGAKTIVDHLKLVQVGAEWKVDMLSK